MRTVCGHARRIQLLLGPAPPPAPGPLRPAVRNRLPLLTDRVGEQRRGGVRLDQVDGTTCGSAVLIALAAWADPAETVRLDGGGRAGGTAAGAGPAAGPGVAAGAAAGAAAGFEERFDERQREVHRESTRFWPQALGTTPWGMVRWLRRHAPGAGPYRVRLVDDTSATDLAEALEALTAALAAGRPVPLLVGSLVPRHYCLALCGDGTAMRVYEPTSGQVRLLDPALVRDRRLARVLGFDRLHAVLLPTGEVGRPRLVDLAG